MRCVFEVGLAAAAVPKSTVAQDTSYFKCLQVAKCVKEAGSYGGGSTSQGDGHVQQHSRKGWLDGKEQSSQVFEKTKPHEYLSRRDFFSGEYASPRALSLWHPSRTNPAMTSFTPVHH